MDHHQSDPNDPLVPHHSSHYRNYNHRPAPSLPHGSHSGAGQYGQITLRPHSAFLHSQIGPPLTRNETEQCMLYGGGSVGLTADDRAHLGALPGSRFFTALERDDTLCGRSPAARSHPTDFILDPCKTTGARRVVSPNPLSQYRQVANPYPHETSSRSTLTMQPIQRSWTLDSPAHSSLAPMKPTHSGRPLTRSPLLRAGSSEGYRIGWSEGGVGTRGKLHGPGGPARAKLGGPGGKSYEEWRAGDSRIVSAPARTPPVKPLSALPVGDRDEGRCGEGDGFMEAKWGGKSVAVRLPPGEMTRSPTPRPLSPDETMPEVKSNSLLPKSDGEPSPSGSPVNAPNSMGLQVPQGASATETVRESSCAVKDQNVIVGLPQHDAWNKLSAGEKHREASRVRREAIERLNKAFESPPYPQTKRNRPSGDWSRDERDPTRNPSIGRAPQFSIESSRAGRLSVSASPFQPVYSLPASVTSHHSADSRRATPSPTKLRPIAPPFEPSAYTRRVFTDPFALPSDATRLAIQRADTDIRRSEAKPLRSSAAPFRPSNAPDVGDHASQPSSMLGLNLYANLWQLGSDGTSEVIAFAKENAGRSVSWDTEQVADDSSAIVGLTSLTHSSEPPKATSFAAGLSSPPTSSISMKRTASGRLRPVAPSFFPTGTFIFRSPIGPAESSAAIHAIKASLLSSAITGQGTGARQSRERESEASRAGVVYSSVGHETRSPASRLHNLSSASSTNGDGPGRDQESEHIGPKVEVESLFGSQYEAWNRSGAPSPSPSPPSRDSGHADNTDRLRQVDLELRQFHPASLPTESFSLQPPLADDRPKAADMADIDGHLQPSDIFTPCVDACIHPSNPARPAPLDEVPPCTPIEAVNASSQDHTTESDQSAASGVLVPRRYLETPATPRKNPDIESQLPHQLSPTPARTRPRITMLDHHSAPSAVSASPSSLIPTLAQSGIQEDNAVSKDTKFLNWIFPSSPTAARRPSVIRRYTFPTPRNEHPSLAGIASTAPVMESTPIPHMRTSIELGGMPPLSSRTSVEFPLRPVRRILTVANGNDSNDATEDPTARPDVSHLTSSGGGGRGVEGYLRRIEGMLKDILSSQGVVAMTEKADAAESVIKLGEQLVGMLSAMRTILEDRLRLFDPPQPTIPDVPAELKHQRNPLTNLSGNSHSPPPEFASLSEEIRRLNEVITASIVGQATLVDHIKSSSEIQDRSARISQTAVEAMQSMKTDLELRKSSEERKDEVLLALRRQVEAAKLGEMKALMEKDQGRERSQELERMLERVQSEKDEMVDRLRELEENHQKAQTRADELESVQVALSAERDGLAVGLRESLRRQIEAESEVDGLRGQLELEKSKADLQTKSSGYTTEKLEAFANESRSFHNDLLQEMARLSRDMTLASQADKGEIECLRGDKRVLQNEVTELRKKTYEAASKIADADLRLATASNAASSVESDLRRSLTAAGVSQKAAEGKVTELEAELGRLKVDKTNLSMIATERSASMRMMEIRHQALIQENIFWRDFALSYDRRAHRKYIQSQPFRGPLISSAAGAPTEEPINRGVEHVLTPTKPTFPDKGAEVEGTPDLSLSASSSAEGLIQDAHTPNMIQSTGRGEGTWWGTEK